MYSVAKLLNGMPLGMEVGRGPGHIALAGDPAPTERGNPHFRPMSVVPNGCMDQGAT